MFFNKLKKPAAMLLTAAMVMTMTACSGSKKGSSDGGEEQSTAEVGDAGNSTEIENSEVELPGDFGDMMYPLEALMVEAYSKGLPYYDENSGEEESDSFWFSMAVLSSQMNTYVKDVTIDTDDTFLYLSEDTVNMYASALYDSYGKGNMEFPEIPEDSKYACYDEEKGAYGFRRGDIGDLDMMITGCEEDSGDYILTAELRDDASNRVLGIYELTITKTSYEGEENAFNYSVSDFRIIMGDEAEESYTEEQPEETTTEVPEEATTETEEEEEETRASISQDEALDMAKDYYGEDAEYSFKGMETVGDDQYYDFSVEGEDISATDVLVSQDGQNVIGGVKNDDGSWSFDQ